MEEMKSSNLPNGWKWCFKRRTKGKSKNKIDIYIFTDDGEKIRSSKELKSYLAVNNIGWMPTDTEQKYLFMPSMIFKNQQSQDSDVTYNWYQKETEINKKSTAEDDNVTYKSNALSDNLLPELKRYEIDCDTALGDPFSIEEVSTAEDDNAANKSKALSDNLLPELKKDEYCYSYSEKNCETALGDPFSIEEVSTAEDDNAANKSKALSDNLLPELKKDEYCYPYSEKICETALGDPFSIEEVSTAEDDNAANKSKALSDNLLSELKKDEYCYPYSEKDCETALGDPFSIEEVSRWRKWVPPRSPLNLLQETFYHDPWQLLIATIFLSKTPAIRATEFFYRFIEKWSTPKILLEESEQVIADFLAPLGLHRTRAKNILRFTHDFLQKNWKDPAELYGIGKYGSDSYKIFCLGQWKTTTPQDHMLLGYLKWLNDKFKHQDVEGDD